MDFDDQTVRAVTEVYFSYDEAAFDGDCFVLVSVSPDIVSFPTSARCDIGTCRVVDDLFRILLTDDYDANE